VQSKAKTSCRQLADKLRQVCGRLVASPGKAIPNGKQDVRKALTNGGQVFGLLGVRCWIRRKHDGTFVAWPCWRLSWAVLGCSCALAPRGAPRLLAPFTTPKQSPVHPAFRCELCLVDAAAARSICCRPLRCFGDWAFHFVLALAQRFQSFRPAIPKTILNRGDLLCGQV
jgi:hypothetical protein